MEEKILSKEEELKKLQELANEIAQTTKEVEENVKEEKKQEKEKQKVLTYKPNNNGFINKFLLALIVGFAGGAVITATYIFLNIGKFTFTI